MHHTWIVPTFGGEGRGGTLGGHRILGEEMRRYGLECDAANQRHAIGDPCLYPP